jgi:predicted dehydrogenase
MGILGCGDVTNKSGPAFQNRGFKIEAVMRRDGDKAADYAKRHGISKYYTDADDLINDPEVMPFILLHLLIRINIMD